jgi:hypothetical protein
MPWEDFGGLIAPSAVPDNWRAFVAIAWQRGGQATLFNQ